MTITEKIIIENKLKEYGCVISWSKEEYLVSDLRKSGFTSYTVPIFGGKIIDIKGIEDFKSLEPLKI